MEYPIKICLPTSRQAPSFLLGAYFGNNQRKADGC